MRYSSNSDKSQFQAFKLEGKKRVKVALNNSPLKREGFF